MVRRAIELGQFAFEVAAHVPDDLFHALPVPRGEHRMPVLGDENQVGVRGEHAAPASANVLY
jgi:hypothetical protein